MSIAFSVINCCEEHVTQRETWSENEVAAQVVLHCDWSLRHALVADLMTGNTSGGPREWPYMTWASDPPRCISCSIAPLETTYTQDAQGMTYDTAKVTVNYSTRAAEDLIAESLEPTAEFMTLDYRRFRWSGADGSASAEEDASGSGTQGDPLQEGEAPGKLIRGLNLVRKHFKVTSVPATSLTLPGSVNHAAYTSSLLGLTFKKETLLFSPPSLERTVKTTGVEAWNVTVKFTYKPDGWNKFWRAKTQRYERIHNLDGTPYNNYPLKDFSTFLY